MKQIGAWILSKKALTAFLISSGLIIATAEADPLHLCPHPDDTLVITHPTNNNDTEAETRWRCGRPVQGGVVDVPPAKTPAPDDPGKQVKPASAPAAKPPVRIVHVVVVKKVFVRPHHHQQQQRGPFDFLFHSGRR
jgi:hypothetical protein